MEHKRFKLTTKYKLLKRKNAHKHVFTIERNDLLVLDALMHDGSYQKYRHHSMVNSIIRIDKTNKM